MLHECLGVADLDEAGTDEEGAVGAVFEGTGDVACLAGNNLLSRASLNGGAPPGWDVDRTPLTGYFRIGHDNRAAA